MIMSASINTGKSIGVSRRTYDRLLDYQAHWQLETHTQHSLGDTIDHLLDLIKSN